MFQRVPIFLGHGVEDEKVPTELGREAASFLQSMDASLEWHEYEGLGHWYSSEMLKDLTGSLKRVTKWGDVEKIEDKGVGGF